MALILVKEDGTGLPNANTYALQPDCDAYHAGHVYASPWTNSSADMKSASLVMATRLIDAECEFLGFRKTSVQSLQWPRVQVPDREAAGVFWAPGLVIGLGPAAPLYLSSDSVPQCVIDATCELAREILIGDRTGGTYPGQGMKSVAIKSGSATKDASGSNSASTASTTVYDKTDIKPVLTRVVEALMHRVLAGSPGKPTVKLIRA